MSYLIQYIQICVKPLGRSEREHQLGTVQSIYEIRQDILIFKNYESISYARYLGVMSIISFLVFISIG